MNSTPMERAGAGEGSFGSYAAGFVFSIVLTVVAFALVMRGGGLPRWFLLCGIFAAAILQILVHLHCFLHLGAGSAARWNVLALIFTALILFLFVAGTLWIMSDLNYRMM
jgi:cytochrome o ubiquinol oxidase operon protein cyoD